MLLHNKRLFMEDDKLKLLADVINNVTDSLAFTILEVGAVPIDNIEEPFYKLLNFFPKSRIIAFEVDQKVCDELNNNAKNGVKYFPVALGDKNTTRTFYETQDPMCSSLYQPNERLMKKYNGLDMAMLKSINTIETMTLDNFADRNDLDDIDFVKIDVQGAELDIFKGATRALENVVFIVSEVEFIPLYVGQPLFGDICNFLTKKKLMFHKFLDLGSRSLKPTIMNRDLYSGSQHMWSDAIFIKDIVTLYEVSPHKLLKMGFLSFLYGSGDVAYHCFSAYDKKNKTSISKEMINILT